MFDRSFVTWCKCVSSQSLMQYQLVRKAFFKALSGAKVTLKTLIRLRHLLEQLVCAPYLCRIRYLVCKRSSVLTDLLDNGVLQFSVMLLWKIKNNYLDKWKKNYRLVRAFLFKTALSHIWGKKQRLNQQRKVHAIFEFSISLFLLYQM